MTGPKMKFEIWCPACGETLEVQELFSQLTEIPRHYAYKREVCAGTGSFILWRQKRERKPRTSRRNRG